MKRENRSKRRLKVLVTSPSLNEDENVSGISSIVREIIEYSDCDFVHFVAGKMDTERIGIFWIFKQIILPIRFLWNVFGQRPDLVHINTAFTTFAILRDFTLTFLARLFGFPVMLHVHDGKFMVNEFRSSTSKWIAGEMLYAANTLLVLNEVEKHRVSRSWTGLDPRILPNAIDCDRMGFKLNPNPCKEIIYFGRIVSLKGLDEIHEACRAIKKMGFEFRFKCYGAGPQTKTFTSAMKNTLGHWFEFGGVAQGDGKWKALAHADIFLLPSYCEGLPMSLLEAMAAKCVVVASDVGSMGDVIEDGVNGFLVAPRDSGQLVEKLEFLLSDKVDWNSIRDHARTTIEGRFSIKDYIRDLEEHYISTVDPAVRRKIN